MRRGSSVVSLTLALCLIGMGLIGMGLVTSARAQVVANPNQIKGELRFTNSNPTIVSLLSDTYKLRLATLTIGAESAGLTPPITSTYYNSAIVGTLSTGYQVTVESSPAGIPYKVGFYANFGKGLVKTSTPLVRQTSPAVYPEPAPDSMMDDNHCVSVMKVSFVDSTGAPLAVTQASSYGYPESSTYTHPTNAYHDRLLSQASAAAGATEIYNVFDGTGITYRVYTQLYMGTDSFVDKMAYRCMHYVQANCDEITEVTCQVPSFNDLGSISGTFGVLGEEVLPSNDAFNGSAINAWNGPFSNERRFRFVTPASGSFFLPNLVPSVAENNYRYTVTARYALRDRARRIMVRAPYFEYDGRAGVEVKAGETTDLGDLFHFKPGYVSGTVTFAGPGASRGGNCFAGLSLPQPDKDTNGDGMVDNLFLYTPAGAE